MITFKSLKIERATWGPNKGKLIAEISLGGGQTTTNLILPDNVGEQVLQLARNAIIDGVEKTANDFIYELTTAIPDTLLLDG
jgi:hypothetical protein